MDYEKACEICDDLKIRHPRWNWVLTTKQHGVYGITLSYHMAEGHAVSLYSETPIVLYAYCGVFY